MLDFYFLLENPKLLLGLVLFLGATIVAMYTAKNPRQRREFLIFFLAIVVPMIIFALVFNIYVTR